jgi:nicotinate-nucleotide adenylyltransferase
VSAIGVLGGSFDPPHCGHVLLAAYALSAGPIDRLIVVPTYVHPWGKKSEPFDHRVAMCELAFGVLRGAEVSRIEEELETPSYTVQTLEALHARGMRDLRLVIGADVLADAKKWKRWERVCELAPPFVVGRGGYGDAPATPEIPELSSTDVRAKLKAGGASGLVPRAVEEYVRRHGLYRG